MTELSRDEQQRRWEAFRARPGNRTCAECAAQDTTWAVLDYGILICIHCAGAHRRLGSHISKAASSYDNSSGPHSTHVGTRTDTRASLLRCARRSSTTLTRVSSCGSSPSATRRTISGGRRSSPPRFADRPTTRTTAPSACGGGGSMQSTTGHASSHLLLTLTTCHSPHTTYATYATCPLRHVPLTPYDRYDEMRFLAGSEQAGLAHTAMRGWLGKQGTVLPASEP